MACTPSLPPATIENVQLATPMNFSRANLLVSHWRREILVAWWLALFLVVVASLLPRVPMPDVPQADKIIHFLVYAGLALVPVGVDFRIQGSVLPAILVVLAVGIAVEFAQESLVVGRDGSIADALADAGGVVIGALIGCGMRSAMR